MNKSFFRSIAKRAIYANPVRRMIRHLRFHNSPLLKRCTQKSVRYERLAERLASESLPPGYYYAKLTIKQWQKHNGKAFTVTVGDRVYYGNTIEPPQRGFPLEYRNIVVPTNNPHDIALSIDADYSVQFSLGRHTTKEQTNYDTKYGVIQDGNLFYSLRGNQVNPSRIIVTFPGFGPSTSRISHAVSYLQALKDHELRDTLMICFQDRYGVAGTYMCVNSGETPIRKEVEHFLDGILEKYRLTDSDMLLFGASKGGTIALLAADKYPKSTLLVVVPQLNLPYYFKKPFFINNLNLISEFHRMEQPLSALHRYCERGQKVHYFYSLQDELSNSSFVEFADTYPQLHKYRVDGIHGAVARKILASLLAIIRTFIQSQSEIAYQEPAQALIEKTATTIALQVRIPHFLERKKTNYFVRASGDGKTSSYFLLTTHPVPTIFYTTENQTLLPELDSLEGKLELVGLHENGKITSYPINLASPHTGKQPELLRPDHLDNLISPQPNQIYTYYVQNNRTTGVIHFTIADSSSTTDRTFTVQRVPTLAELNRMVKHNPDNNTVFIYTETSSDNLEIFINHMHTDYGYECVFTD